MVERGGLNSGIKMIPSRTSPQDSTLDPSVRGSSAFMQRGKRAAVRELYCYKTDDCWDQDHKSMEDEEFEFLLSPPLVHKMCPAP